MPKIKIVKKPWGHEEWFACTNNYAGKILFIRKGCRLSLQYHRKKDETLYLDKGKLKIQRGKINGKLSAYVVKAGYAFHVPPNTVHRTEALEDCRVIEVSTPYLDDVVRLQDDYNRATPISTGKT